MITKYTHIVYIRRVGTTQRHKAFVRKVGKWWETKDKKRRFDSDGYEKGHYDNIKWKLPDTWLVEIKTLEKVKK